MIFRLGELFCGPGGIAKGAATANINNPEWGITHQWANDYDKDTCQTYIRNICPDNPESVVCGDIRKLDFDQLYNIGEIDALAFGFPCNDFSVVGEQKGINGNFGPLYSYGIKVLQDKQPQWFLAENVGGLKSANEGYAFERIKADMISAGYRIYPNLYKFEDYGIPQARHRVIIIGIRNDLPFDFKVPSTNGYVLKTCREAIDVPPIQENASNNEYTVQSAQVVERLNHRCGQICIVHTFDDHNSCTCILKVHRQICVRIRECLCRINCTCSRPRSKNFVIANVCSSVAGYFTKRSFMRVQHKRVTSTTYLCLHMLLDIDIDKTSYINVIHCFRLLHKLC